ncbi:hypothetical protein OROHE_018839 [Orobanche hederae]
MEGKILSEEDDLTSDYGSEKSEFSDIVESSDGDDRVGASDVDDNHSREAGFSEADDSDTYHGEDRLGESDYSSEVVEESDSSEDECFKKRSTRGGRPTSQGVRVDPIL